MLKPKSILLMSFLAACNFEADAPSEPSAGDDAARFVRVSRDGTARTISLGERREALRLAGLVPRRGQAAPGWQRPELGPLWSFDPIAPEEDPLAYPTSATVRLATPDSSEGVGIPGHCSGILVAPSIVVTAAHCVVSGNTGTLYGLPEVAAVPLGEYLPFGQEIGPFGRAEAYQIDYPEDYTGSPGFAGDTTTGAELDVAIVWLDRPLGALSGWVSYAADTCDNLTTQSYTTTAYPGDGHDGVMHTFEGNFDDCPNGHAARAFDSTVYGGMSGGAAYRFINGQPHAVAAWSLTALNIPHAARYYPTFVNWLDTVVAEVGDANSLYALELRTGTAQVAPELDGAVDDVSFKLFRHGDTPFDGDVTADFYLVPKGHLAANDDAVIAAGTHVGSYTFAAELQGNETQVIDVPDGEVHIPGSLVPSSSEADRELAVVLSGAFDPQPYNTPAIGILTGNTGVDGYTYAAGLWDRAPLRLTNPRSDVRPTQLVVHNVDLGLGIVGPLQTSFAMLNEGTGVSGDLEVTFYLSRTQAPVPGLSPDWIKVETGVHEGGLAPGETYAEPFFIQIPPEAVGSYYLLANVENTDVELDVSDQWLATSRAFVLSTAPGQLTTRPPDLKVEYVGLGDDPAPRHVQVAFSIKNVGGSVADSWEVKFYARPVGGGPDVFLATGTDAPIASGATLGRVLQVPVNAVPAGTWRIVLRTVDADDPVATNNVGVTVGTFVRPPGLNLGP